MTHPTDDNGSGTSQGPDPAGRLGPLVLLINTVLGGLGTLFATTGSVVVTLVAAMLVFVVVLVVLLTHTSQRSGQRSDGQRRRRTGGWCR